MKIGVLKNWQKLTPLQLAKQVRKMMLREHGSGFSMSVWKGKFDEDHAYDGKLGSERGRPSCGTVMCIGGTYHALIGINPTHFSFREKGNVLGISHDQMNALFYEWVDYVRGGYSWRKKEREAFAAAKTPLAKARIAGNYLLEVVRTKGKALEFSGKSE